MSESVGRSKRLWRCRQFCWPRCARKGRTQMASLLAHLRTVVASSMIMAACAASVMSYERTFVEVWHVGDDGLSQRLAVGLDGAFTRSPDFTLSSGRKPGTLVVTIPSNVEWKQIGKRTQAIYTVRFSSIDGRSLGARKGSCWDDDLSKCADQIVKDAKVAARKIH
jgi:hypothetical protein